MGTKGFVRLNAIWKMLDRCAPGHIRTLRTHHWWITWGGLSFRELPKGSGPHRNALVRFQNVEKIVRVLRIDPDCAARFFRQMR